MFFWAARCQWPTGVTRPLGQTFPPAQFFVGGLDAGIAMKQFAPDHCLVNRLVMNHQLPFILRDKQAAINQKLRRNKFATMSAAELQGRRRGAGAAADRGGADVKGNASLVGPA